MKKIVTATATAISLTLVIVGVVFAANHYNVTYKGEIYDGETACRNYPFIPGATYLGQMHPRHQVHYRNIFGEESYCEVWAKDQLEAVLSGLTSVGYEIVKDGQPISSARYDPSVGLQRSNPSPHHRSIATVDGWEVTVLSVISNADSIIESYDTWNSPPEPGKQFVMARIRTTREPGHSSDDFSVSRLKAITGTGSVAFDEGCRYADLPDEYSSDEVLPGGTLEGNVCWEIGKSDVSSLLMYDSGSYYSGNSEIERRWWRLVG